MMASPSRKKKNSANSMMMTLTTTTAMLRARMPGAFGDDPGDARRAHLAARTSRLGMSRPNRWRCSQLHARCTRSSPCEPPAARSIEPSVCLASSMNAITISTNGTTMMSATAAVLIDAARVLPKRASSRLYRE